MPSRELQTYLEERAAGESIPAACMTSGIPLAEARLTEKAIESGELTLPIPPEEERTMPKTDAPGADEKIVELAADTLRGDVRDALLSWIKNQQKPWSALGESEQKDVCDAADRLSYSIVKQASEIIAKGERPCVVAKLVEYKEKDGVEAKLKLGSTEDVIRALHEACGQEVLLVTTGAEDFSGEQAPAEDHVEREQPELGIGAEYENA